MTYIVKKAYEKRLNGQKLYNIRSYVQYREIMFFSFNFNSRFLDTPYVCTCIRASDGTP